MVERQINHIVINRVACCKSDKKGGRGGTNSEMSRPKLNVHYDIYMRSVM